MATGVAIAIGLSADALQGGLFASMPAFSWVPSDALDLVVAITRVVLLGFRWRFVLALAIELVPGAQLFPSWTAFVLSLPTTEAVPELRRVNGATTSASLYLLNIFPFEYARSFAQRMPYARTPSGYRATGDVAADPSSLEHGSDACVAHHPGTWGDATTQDLPQISWPREHGTPRPLAYLLRRGSP